MGARQRNANSSLRESVLASLSAVKGRLVVRCFARYFCCDAARCERVRHIAIGQGDKVMMSTVIGGAMLPHAPQFFTMPETEDKKNVEHVREVSPHIPNNLPPLHTHPSPTLPT